MIQIQINSVDRSDCIVWESLKIEQNLTSQVDSIEFNIRKIGAKVFTPAIGDIINVYEDSTLIFSGSLLTIEEKVESNADGLLFSISGVDWTHALGDVLVSEVYEAQTIEAIIADMISSYAPTFTTTNTSCTFTIERIVFNQVSIAQCIKKLAEIVQYDWYVDEDKDIHFFSKFTNTAPYNLTDTSGNYIYASLQRSVDGSQIANRVKVRGGEYNALTYTDVITVKGNDSKSFKLPYKFADLSIELDTGGGYVAKTVGIDFVDDFTTKDVLYNYNERSFRFEVALADGNKIRFSGSPKVPVLAIAEDAVSIATYGVKEKLIRDNTIEDISTARQRAIAELGAYKDAVSDVKFDTYTAGLRPGMFIGLDSTLRNVSDSFLIKQVVFSTISPIAYKYAVQVVSTRKYGLIELLQKLLEPDPEQADDSEVSEKIKTDIMTLGVAELIDVILATTDDNTITCSEDIQDDPIGAGVEPIWVLGTYFPSSHADTKRQGRLDYSMKLY